MVPGYREVRQLGAGRTGRVFLATYQATGAYVAIKYLNATLRRDDEFMTRFRAESPRLVEIDDPNVVTFYEYVETGTRAAVVMEVVDGVSLRTLLTEHGRTSPEAALVLLKGTLLGLAAAHEKGVAHRDVKPENVLVQADGAAKLADFGVVVHAEEPGVPAGSPPYMSPELWTHGTAGIPADLYAAACLLFECVKGRPPFRADDIAALRDKHLVEPVPVEVVPDTLRDLLRRGLAKDPAVRYASARQFAAELEEDAVAGYGPGWEQRGRRHLAELATLLALRFPLAKPDADASPSGAPEARRERRKVTLPRLPPHLWVAGGAVVAVLIGLMLSGGRLPPGPGMLLVPPDDAPQGVAQSPATSARKPGSTPAASPPPASPKTSPTGRPARTATRGVSPPGVPTDAPPPTPPASTPPPTPTAVPTPTATATGGGLPRTSVRSASIMGWSGSAGAVRVAASGAGPVRLTVSYTRRDDGESSRVVHKETTTLSGQTSYTSGFTRDLGDVGCGERAYFGVVVLTTPAAANGPQVSEVAMDGPACPPASPSASQSSSSPSRGAASPPTPSSSPSPSEALVD
ncbi:serine/threonine-protein kinase [Nonomuraea endophytica]|uniref:non-specific serine/threonine protein kinase n=1 Tax=Nonomuraea endophytica TaxID=714136 RepID=A0A7W8A6P7_9ACTN|nr:serine/threonine-protein kinase [Nonomuraea endophytica]MBB5080580.1 serine/threonine-protein kinase [Nonomuraea endophytica]